MIAALLVGIFGLNLSATVGPGNGMTVTATIGPAGTGPYQYLFDCDYPGSGVHNWDHVVNTDNPVLQNPLTVTRSCPTLSIVHVSVYDKGAGWALVQKQIFPESISASGMIGLASPPCNDVPHDWEIEWADGLLESFQRPVGEIHFPERPHWDWRSRTRPTGTIPWSEWTRWFPSTPYPGDNDGDTVVDNQDFQILRQNFGNVLP